MTLIERELLAIALYESAARASTLEHRAWTILSRPVRDDYRRKAEKMHQEFSGAI